MTDAEKKLQQEIGQQILLVKIIQEQNRSLTGFYGVSKDSLCKWSGYTKAEIDNLIGFTGIFDLHTFLLRFLREFPLAKIFESRDGCQYLACFLRCHGKGSYDKEYWKRYALTGDGLKIHNDWFRSAYPQCDIPEEATVEVLTEVLDFEKKYLFSATLEARKYFEMDVIKQMLAGMESIGDREDWFSVYQDAFELYALKKFSDGDWVKTANEENEKETERILKWLQDHPKIVELLTKRELSLRQETTFSGDGVDVDFVRELLKTDGLEPDFTPGELLEGWKKML